MAKVRDPSNDAERHDQRHPDASDWQAARAADAQTQAARARANEVAELPSGGRATQVGGNAIAASQADPARLATRRRGFTTVLRNRYFLRLWMAQLISQTALNAANFGLIVLIQTQIKSFTATSGAIIMFALPALIFGAPAGVLVDHFDRRRVLWVSNLSRAVVSGLFVLALLSPRPALVPAYVLAFLLATISQFFAPAEGAAIPLLVHSDELINALALFNVTFTLAQVAGLIILGPVVFLVVTRFTLPVGDISVVVVPAEVLFATLAVLYVICAGLILLIPHEALAPTPQRSAPTRPLRIRHDTRQIGSIWRGMLQSWTHIRHDESLLVAVLQLGFGGSVIAVVALIAPQFVYQFFHLPTSLAALVFVPAGAGLVIGSALVPRIHQHLRYSGTVFAGVVALAVSAALLPLVQAIASSPALHIHDWYSAWPYVALILALTFIIGVALDLINVPAQNMLQERAPDWIKGRVLAVQALLLNAVTIPFVVIMGRIADIWGLMTAIEALAVIIITLGLTSVYFGMQGQRRNAAFGGYNALGTAGDERSRARQNNRGWDDPSYTNGQQP